MRLRTNGRVLALAAVGSAMAASALLIALETSNVTLQADEWGYALRATNPLGEALFEPPGRKYLLTFPMLFYEGAFNVVGIDSHLPARVLGIALLLLCAGLFFAHARRAVGDLAAVPPTVLLLFLGAAWDVVLTPLRVPALMSIAAGLGMLLLLERRDLRSDLAAAGLLVVSLGSHPTSLVFAVAAAVTLLLRPPRWRLRRSWVVLVPLALYAGWWLFVRDSGAAARPEPANLLDVPEFLAESFVAITTVVTGLAWLVGEPGVLGVEAALNSPLSWLAASALLSLIGLALMRRSTPLPATFWVALAALLALWVLTALAPRDVEIRGVTSGRYLYPGTLLFLLVLCELLRDVRIPRALAWSASAVLAVGVAYNVSHLLGIADPLLRNRADQIKAYVSMLELARDRVDPEFRSREGYPARQLKAENYFAIADEFGTPAYTPAELASRPPPTRELADSVLAQALEVQLQPGPEKAALGGPAPVLEALAGDSSAVAPGCVRLRPANIALQAQLLLPREAIWLRSERLEDVMLSLGRFAAPAFALSPPPGAETATLTVPTDGDATPWRLHLTSPAPISVCGLKPPG